MIKEYKKIMELLLVLLIILMLSFTCVIAIAATAPLLEETTGPTICGFTNRLFNVLCVTDKPLPNEEIIRLAEEKGVMNKDEYGPNRYDEKITRQTAAKLTARALKLILNENIYPDYDAVAKIILDYDNICSTCQRGVAELYAAGIVQGYPGGSFEGRRKLTEQEMNLIFKRLIDENERIWREL